MATRHLTLTLVVVALGAWLSLLLFGKLVAPEGALPRLIFLVLLFIALAASFTPIARLLGTQLVRSKWYAQRSLRHALRQGTLIALAIVANLALHALGAWSWADVILIALAVVLVELIALARK